MNFEDTLLEKNSAKKKPNVFCTFGFQGLAY